MTRMLSVYWRSRASGKEFHIVNIPVESVERFGSDEMIETTRGNGSSDAIFHLAGQNDPSAQLVKFLHNLLRHGSRDAKVLVLSRSLSQTDENMLQTILDSSGPWPTLNDFFPLDIGKYVLEVPRETQQSRDDFITYVLQDYVQKKGDLRSWLENFHCKLERCDLQIDGTNFHISMERQDHRRLMTGDVITWHADARIERNNSPAKTLTHDWDSGWLDPGLHNTHRNFTTRHQPDFRPMFEDGQVHTATRTVKAIFTRDLEAEDKQKLEQGLSATFALAHSVSRLTLLMKAWKDFAMHLIGPLPPYSCNFMLEVWSTDESRKTREVVDSRIVRLYSTRHQEDNKTLVDLALTFGFDDHDPNRDPARAEAYLEMVKDHMTAVVLEIHWTEERQGVVQRCDEPVATVQVMAGPEGGVEFRFLSGEMVPNLPPQMPQDLLGTIVRRISGGRGCEVELVLNRVVVSSRDPLANMSLRDVFPSAFQ